MERVYVTGFNWVNVESVMRMTNRHIRKTEFKRLKHIESLVVKESSEK